eukprot:GFUD01072885.1.p1 GENE.GFUD01072885.1~~GFUD01072885.1.p1  ORF type:complete len:327 (-),score=61.99 GFUD01072885.1:6-986(-)
MRENHSKYAVLLLVGIPLTLLVYNHSVSYSMDTKAVPSIWASMSLCWSENHQDFGKSEYPYRFAAQLSSRLWRKITDAEVNVLLTIIYNEDTNMEDLENYVKTFETEEGVVIILEKTSTLGCVLQSQLSRMFAFKNKFIHDEDIILISDVDIFVMDKKIVEPLKLPFTTWIYQYGRTEREGVAFGMSIIGMRSKGWRKVFDYSHVGVDGSDMSDIVQHLSNELNVAPWDIDQVMVSYSILSHGFCTLPDRSPLWTELRLTQPATSQAGEQDNLSPSSHCYKGDTQVCERGKESVPEGCLFWHFYPDQGEGDMKIMFDQFMNETSNV